MAEKPKSLFDKAIDALTDRDEKEAAAKAKAEAEAKAAAEKRAADAKAAADQAAAAKAAAAKAIADKAAADKMIAAQQEAARKAAEAKAAAATAAAAAAAPKKGVVTARSLHIRKDHDTKSAEVGGLVKGNEVTWTETWTDGKNTWVKLGPDQWAAMIYNGETYIQAA
jgi:hypothetical protein